MSHEKVVPSTLVDRSVLFAYSVSSVFGVIIHDLTVSSIRDPSIKRTICKHCHTLLIPGITARVRVRRRRERHIVVTCLECQTIKRYLCRANYVLWSEKQNNPKQQDNDKDGLIQENQMEGKEKS